MIFKQYYLGCLAHASYLMADEGSRTAALVDPQRDVGQYLEDARREGLVIRHVFLTHLHADFLAGHLEVRERTGAAIHLGAQASAEYEFTAMRDGGRLALGPGVELQVLETPGHTPESICILIFDRQAGADPWAVLTGDTLFVGDVGRPDLRASLGWAAEDLARRLYDSLHTKLLALPDTTLVYPAHGAGSLCGKSLGTENHSTIGAQRAFNYALQPMTRDAFIRLVTADQPDAPAYFTYDAVLNAHERPTLEESLEKSMRPLALEEFLRLAGAGAQILDTRDPAEFAACHLAGSLNIGLGGQYATWAGTLVDMDRTIVLVAAAGREYESAMRLGRIGFDRVAGYLADAGATFTAHPELVCTVERMSAERLAQELEPAAAETPVVLDVRNPGERAGNRVEGSLHIPLSQLEARIGEVPAGRRIVVHCAGGYRSSIAASLLRQHGYAHVAELEGGIQAWIKEFAETSAK